MSSFLDQSLLLSQWDEALLSTSSTLHTIQSQVTSLQSSQLHLNKCIDVVQTQQKDLNRQLDELETALDTLRPSPPTENPSVSGDDLRREETYRLAEEVDEHLTGIARTLGETIEVLNERVGGAGGGGRGAGVGGMWAQLVDILNVHQQSLQWLEREAEDIERGLHRTGQEVVAAKQFNGARGVRLTEGYGESRR